MSEESSQMITLAEGRRAHGIKKPPDRSWGLVLHLDIQNPLLRAAGNYTCDRCALADAASYNICRDCPGVDLLVYLRHRMKG